MSEPDKKYRPLADATREELMTPPEQQINPSLAAAVEPENINREIDTSAARGDVPEFRAAGVETVGDSAAATNAPPKSLTDTKATATSASGGTESTKAKS